MYCPDQWTKYKEYFEESISKSHYDLYILMNPDCEPIQDGTRRYLDSRLEHYDQLKSHLIKFGKNWVEVGGSWENRYTESKKAISDLDLMVM
jgi:nicotinamide riboside kinase